MYSTTTAAPAEATTTAAPADATTTAGPTTVPGWLWLAGGLWALKALAAGGYILHRVHAR